MLQFCVRVVHAVTNEKPHSAAVHKVKKTTDKDSYKKKQTWPLVDLSLVDGKDADTVSI